MFIGDYISYVKEGNKYVIVQIYEYNGKKRSQYLRLYSIYCIQYSEELSKLGVKFGGDIVDYNLFFDTEKQAKDFIDFMFKTFDLPLLRKYNEGYFFIDILKNMRSLLKKIKKWCYRHSQLLCILWKIYILKENLKLYMRNPL